MSKEIVVDIEYEGKPAQVTLRKITYGERNEIIRKALGGGKIKYYSEESTVVEIDPFDMRETLLLKSIKEAPFPHETIQHIRDLDAEIADKIIEKAEELNPFRSIL